MNWTAPKAIECFHLGLLAALRTRVRPERYVLKGGANLRYFFGSPRYSVDIDFDITDQAAADLIEDQVDAALALAAPIVEAAGITVNLTLVSKPKQTDTTRRWKVPLIVPGFDDPIRTKVEFSGRPGDTRFELEPVPVNLVRPYGLSQPTVQRYLSQAATNQKVLALALRNQTQARDVFDLDLLMRSNDWDEDELDPSVRSKASHAAEALGYSDFRDQVLPFLDPEIVDLYDEEEWNKMQVQVIQRLHS